MKKLLMIANLHSGKAEIGECIGDMVDYCNKKGFVVTVYSTQYRGHITEIIRNCGEEYDNVIICGGDGSLNEALNAYMVIDKKPKMGYIPCGSANDFAASIGIPPEIADAYRVAVSGKPFTMDVGRLNGKYFSYVAAFGLFTNLPYETPQGIKNILGYQAYVLEGIKQLSSIKAWNMKVKYDGGEAEDEFILGLVSNSNRVAGMKLLIPTDLSDGLFEVVLIRKPKLLTALPSLISCLVENNYDNDLILAFKTSSLSIECDKYVKWTIDGERAGRLKKADIAVINKAFTINIP